jgi:hypothetical protein
MQALTACEGKQANKSQEKEEMVKSESLPPNVDDQYCELPPMPSAHRHDTEQAVERDAGSQSVNEAPRLEKLSFGGIRLR